MARFRLLAKNALYGHGVERSTDAPGLLAGHPPEQVHRSRIGEASDELIGQNLEEEMGQEVFVIIDIGLDDVAPGCKRPGSFSWEKAPIFPAWTTASISALST
jgi:hypothetical protein